MIMLENGHYYHVRIIPHLQDNHWSLGAVDSILRATTGLPDNPTPLLPNQPPDPLTAIVSGAASPGTQATPPTASGGGRGAAGRTPGRGQRRGDSTSTAGSRPRPSRNRRRKPPLSPTYAPSSRSTRSGHWRWVGSCSPPSALRRRPGRRTPPWCTKSSVPSAAPLYDVRVTPQGPDPRPTTGPATTTATGATNVRARSQPRRPPHPPTHPPPPPPHPPLNHTNNTPPTPRGLQAVRHHLGPAHHRAPDKSVRPNGRRNDIQHNTTRPQGARDT